MAQTRLSDKNGSPSNGQVLTKAAIEQAEEKPNALAVQPDGIPQELCARPQWVCWRYEWRVDKRDKRKGKWTKAPVCVRTVKHASSTDPGTWCDFAEALAYHRAHPKTTDGIGFVFSPDDPFTGIDLDDSLEPATGLLRDWARPLVELLSSYTEVSPSGTGVKVCVRGKLPADVKHKLAYGGGAVEVYDAERFFAMTGRRLEMES